MKIYNLVFLIGMVMTLVACGTEPNEPVTEAAPINRWYVSVQGERTGPFTADQIKEQKITEQTDVLLEGTTTWVKAKDFPELVTASAPEPVTVPATVPVKVIKYSIINEANPGVPIDIKGYIQPGVTTIFDFYSEGCPPCRMIAPKLKELSGKRADICVMKIDINRKGKGGIDWESPIVGQYGFQSIPYFIIYYPNGSSINGEPASQAVYNLLSQAGIDL